MRSWARTHAKDAANGAGSSQSADGTPNAQEKGHVSDSEHAGASIAPASEAEGKGTVLNPDQEDDKKKPNVTSRFLAVAKKVLLHSWINVLLVFVPVGIVVAVVPNMNAGVVFAMNAIAIIPLAGLLSHATESVAHRLGDTLGALLNVSFGNAVELIIFIIALVKNEIRIVQASLLGSILANLLLILGMAFFLGGLRYREQIYNSTVTQMSACLLSLSVISLVLPTAFHASFSDKNLADANSLIISRGTSVRKASIPIDPLASQSGENVVGLVPGNAEIASNDGVPRRVDFAETLVDMDGTAEPGIPRRPFNNIRGISLRPVAKSLTPTVFTQPPNAEPPFAGPTGPVPRVRLGIRRTNSLPDRLNQYKIRAPGAMMPAHIPLAALSGAGEDLATDEENDNISQKAAVVMLLISTALVAVCAEFMVDAIDAVVENSPLKETFIGLIILPIVGNAAEHVTAVAVAMKNKMDLAIGVAVGSSIQIALLLTPFVVILGWIIDRDMTLYFTLFETVCLFVSAFIVNFLVLDGRSNYLEGALLCSTYVIIALVAFYYPEGSDANEWGGAE
ncbi:putative ca2+ h+-exchanging protein [Eutypa lata UCREL1]|uniref:Putative ca2+ h+-exchanging protein n=1 Tax=Eutypa lata (strain UCR-EL1) TaxID=1287681 RepID=M7S7V3_EUTLA|nr:putative ca2+ h+-exchanging protein [Eutypa lata UCREL1]